MRNKAFEYVEQNFGKTETERFKLEVNEFLSWYEIGSARRSKPFADMIPTLTELKRFGAKMALVTNTSAEAEKVVFSTTYTKRLLQGRHNQREC